MLLVICILLWNKNISSIVKAIDAKAFLVKAIYFNKPSNENWYVTWHQDIPINVNQKVNLKGFTSWTKKGGINSVCPPEEISKNIFTLRIHLDETGYKNGPLKVIPGSHKKRFNDKEIQTITENSVPYTCEVSEGGVQLLKPLLLHSSAKSISQKNRRVIHLEFCSTNLPKPLKWLEKENF